MDFSDWLKSLEQTGLATGIRNSLYLFPFLEAVHVMALSVVFGTITIVDLRVLGIASTHRPFTRMSPELLRLTWGAFAVSALTGSLMFTTNARVYAHNTAFCLKMVLLLLAGLNMAFFHLTAGRTVALWDRARSAPTLGRIAATLSLTLWIAIVFSGRVIGFTTTGAQAREVAPPPATNFDDFLTGTSQTDPQPAAPAGAAGAASSAPAGQAKPASSAQPAAKTPPPGAQNLRSVPPGRRCPGPAETSCG